MHKRRSIACPPSGEGLPPILPRPLFSTLTVTTKQLHKIAKINGWTKSRNGGKHFIYKHEQLNLQVTVPYQVKNDFVGKLIANQLTV